MNLSVFIYVLLSSLAIIPSMGVSFVCEKKRLSPTMQFFLPYCILFLILTSVGFIIMTPGGISPDSEYAMRKILTGTWEGLHPNGLTILMLLTKSSIIGPWPIVLINVSLISFGTISIFALTSLKNVRINIILSSLIFFYPPIFTLLGMVWKDLLLLAVYIAAIVIAIIFRNAKNVSFKFEKIKVFFQYRAMLLVICLLLLSYGVLVKLNAPPAALPIVFFLFLPSAFKTLKSMVTFILLICITTAFAGILLQHLNDKLSDSKFDMLYWERAYEIAYIAYKTTPNQLGELEDRMLKKNVSIKEIFDVSSRSSRAVKFNNSLKNPWPSPTNLEDQKSIDEVNKAWWRLVMENPLVWLDLKLSNFMVALGHGTPSLTQASYVNSFYNYESYPFKLKQSTLARWFWQYYVIPSESIFIYMPSIYFFFGIFLFFISILKRFSSRRVLLTLLSSGLMLEFSTASLVGHYEFRWSHYLIYMCTMACGLMIRDVFVLNQSTILSTRQKH